MTFDGVPTPVRVRGITNAVAIAGGDGYSCAVLSTGRAECWGTNFYGELGNGSPVTVTPNGQVVGSSPTPVAVFGVTNATSIAAGGGGLGGGHTCATLANGAVDCWGDNDEGQLGNGTFGEFCTPSGCVGPVHPFVCGAFGCMIVDAGSESSIPTPVVGITNAVGVGVGSFHSCAVLSSGQVDCWGYNGYGELGDGTTTRSSIPVAATGLRGAAAVAAETDNSCALESGGGVACWGYNASGQLGDGTSAGPESCPASFANVAGPCSTTPVGVSGITNATAVTAGGSTSGTDHGCALQSTGGVECWGDNTDGELGNGTTSSSSTPVPVTGIP
jgi:alpha-tubulin suppressor-like RCC1 family protein